MGVKDSKMLQHPLRKVLAKKIKSLALDHAVIAIPPETIDRALVRSELNKLEIQHFRELIDTFKPDKVIIDCPEVNLKRFEQKLRNGLKHQNVEMVIENFADANHVEVGAASILAKVKREKIVAELSKVYGDFGSGYCSDPQTIEFLKRCWKEMKSFPDCVRKNWVTVKGIPSELEQKKLKEFFK